MQGSLFIMYRNDIGHPPPPPSKTNRDGTDESLDTISATWGASTGCIITVVYP